MVNFPSSLDSLANPDETTFTDDPGFELDVVISRIHDILEALEAKVGIGTTTPDAAHKTAKATAAGVSAWGYSSMVKLGEAAGDGSTAYVEVASIPSTSTAM